MTDKPVKKIPVWIIWVTRLMLAILIAVIAVAAGAFGHVIEFLVNVGWTLLN